MGAFRFPKNKRILKRQDFVNLNRSGRRYQSKNFIVICKLNGLGFTRLGITVRKKIGNAVKRNRIKRLIREFFRLNKTRIPQGCDILIIAKKDVSSLGLRKVEDELGEVIFNAKWTK